MTHPTPSDLSHVRVIESSATELRLAQAKLEQVKQERQKVLLRDPSANPQQMNAEIAQLEGERAPC